MKDKKFKLKKENNDDLILFFNIKTDKDETKEILEKKRRIENIENEFKRFEKLYYDLLSNEYVNEILTSIENKNKNSLFYKDKNENKDIDLRTIAFFKDGYNPEWEDVNFLNGGFYYFQIEYVNNIRIEKLLNGLNDMMKKYKDLKGFRIKMKKLRGVNFLNIQFWTVFREVNDKIREELKNLLHAVIGTKMVDISFMNFYDLPIPSDNNISYKDFGDKKIYYLRFDVGIGQFIRRGTWWESFMEKYFKKYYKPNTNVIDVGANIGSHTILMGNMVSKNCQVFSFEPVYWDIVLMNADLNRIQDKVCVFNKGLGKRNEILKIKTYDRSMKKAYGRVSLDGLSGLEEDKDLSIEKEVGIITLDSLKLMNISEIKIDVEGMELDVLIGARETIKRERPVIFIEILKPKYKEVMNSEIMRYIMKKCRYNLIKIPEGYSDDDYILVPSGKKE